MNDGAGSENLTLSRRQALGSLLTAGSAAVALAASTDAAAAVQPASQPGPSEPSLLYPHPSRTRATIDLSGLWRFKLDPDEVGETQGWSAGLSETRAIPVPCSWNDLFDDARMHFGPAWYETEVRMDSAWAGKAVLIRFGSAVYRAKAWLDGRLLGEHVGGHLPFAFDIAPHGRPGEISRLVVMVENALRPDRAPATTDAGRYQRHTIHYPQTTYDFFPYSGLHRPVLLCVMPQTHVHSVEVDTARAGRDGQVRVAFAVAGRWNGPATVEVAFGGSPITARIRVQDGRATAQLTVPEARLWGPDDPFLYRLTIRLGDDAEPIDEYHLKIGIRTIEARDGKLLLNGEPLFLRGFGKHEDFPLHGRGLDLAALVRDLELLKWIGANSFRTSHYPYAEEALQLADEYGFLIIDETPAVSIVMSDPAEQIEARRQRLTQMLSELVARDRNHPCVIMWSVANEPIRKPFHTTNAAPDDAVAKGTAFFRSIFDHLRSLDRSRPSTVVTVHSGPDEWRELGDVICVNSYLGWYDLSGDLTRAEQQLDTDYTSIGRRHPGKPIIMSEFGADATPGAHAQPPEMWSEEFQAAMIAMYLRVAQRNPQIVGTHPWAFADFKTSESIQRVSGQNFKGVFTRDRRPKIAAHELRRAWTRRLSSG